MYIHIGRGHLIDNTIVVGSQPDNDCTLHFQLVSVTYIKFYVGVPNLKDEVIVGAIYSSTLFISYLLSVSYSTHNDSFFHKALLKQRSNGLLSCLLGPCG